MILTNLHLNFEGQVYANVNGHFTRCGGGPQTSEEVVCFDNPDGVFRLDLETYRD